MKVYECKQCDAPEPDMKFFLGHQGFCKNCWMALLVEFAEVLKKAAPNVPEAELLHFAAFTLGA